MTERETEARPLTLDLNGTSHRVEPGRCFRIGRHEGNDLPLVDHHASRFHAQVCWVDGQPFVEDLLSVNGTFLDGRRVQGRSPLRPGQRLLIGDSKIDIEAADRPPALLAKDAPAPDEVQLFTEIGAPRLEGSFTKQSTLHQLLLDLEWEERTGTLELRLGVRRVQLVFSLGKIVRAVHQHLTGLPAIARAAQASVGSYLFRPTFAVSDDAPPLSISPRQFLREGFWATRRSGRATRRHGPAGRLAA